MGQSVNGAGTQCEGGRGQGGEMVENLSLRGTLVEEERVTAHLGKDIVILNKKKLFRKQSISLGLKLITASTYSFMPEVFLIVIKQC